jgi:hypothetical protein
MKYIYGLILSLFATCSYGYDTLVPINYGQVLINPVQVVQTQIMVYNTPYFTVTVPVPITTPVIVAQPVQQTFYWWGYPYKPMIVNEYWHHRCRLLNFNY